MARDDRATNAEVSGAVVAAVVDLLDDLPSDDRSRATSIFAEHGLSNPDPDEWYSLSAFVDAVEAVDRTLDVGASDLGARAARAVTVPETATDVPGALAVLDDAYGETHRGEDLGGYGFRQIGDDDGRVECDTPYPCAFDRGLVEGVADRVASGFVCLREVGVCRSEGGDRCTYELSW